TVYGAVPRDSDKPGDRACTGLIEGRALVPNGHINLLQHVFRLASVIQDTKADAKKLRRGHVIDKAERGPIALRRTIECCGELLAFYVGIHARPRPWRRLKDAPLSPASGR